MVTVPSALLVRGSNAVSVPPNSLLTNARLPSLVNASARGRMPVGTSATTAKVVVSMAVTLLSCSDVTYTTLPSGRTLTPSGSLPTGTRRKILPLSRSSTLSSAVSSFETNSVLPSFERSKVSGSWPLGSVRTSLRSTRSTTPMPSAERSGGGSFDSSMFGPPRGEPDNATNKKRPSLDTFNPRGLLPTGMRAATDACSGSITKISPLPSALTYSNFASGFLLQPSRPSPKTQAKPANERRIDMGALLAEAAAGRHGLTRICSAETSGNAQPGARRVQHVHGEVRVEVQLEPPRQRDVQDVRRVMDEEFCSAFEQPHGARDQARRRQSPPLGSG